MVGSDNIRKLRGNFVLAAGLIPKQHPSIISYLFVNANELVEKKMLRVSINKSHIILVKLHL
jgi:hypothetical protein